MPAPRIPPPLIQNYGGGGAYGPQYGQTLADLIMHGATARAQGIQQQGQAWGQGLANAGQMAGGAIQQAAQAQEMAKRDAAWVAYVEGGTWADNPQEAYAQAQRSWGPEKAGPQFQGLMGAAQLMRPERNPEADRKSLGQMIGAIDATPEGPARQRLYRSAATLVPRVYPDAEFSPEYNPEEWPALSALGAQLRGDKPPEDFNLSPGQARFKGTTGQQLAALPAEPPKPPTAGSFEDYMTATPEQQAVIREARKGYQQADDRPRITVNTNTPRPLSQTAEAQLVQSYTKEWDSAAAPARTITRQVGMMESGLEAARRGDRAAGAQAIIQTFNKILDPESAVREGEYARSAAGQSLMNRIKGALEQVQQGGANMPLDQLETFASLAREMAAKQQAYLPEIQARIAKKAERYNIPPEIVFGATSAAPAAPVAGGPPPPAGARPVVTVNTPAEAARLPRGTQFRTPDGQLRVVP